MVDRLGAAGLVLIAAAASGSAEAALGAARPVQLVMPVPSSTASTTIAMSKTAAPTNSGKRSFERATAARLWSSPLFSPLRSVALVTNGERVRLSHPLGKG